MFYEIEKLFKKESPNNKINMRLIPVYIISVTLMYVADYFSIPYPVIIPVTLIILLVLMFHIHGKVLGIKLRSKLFCNKNNSITVSEEIYNQEVELMKSYLRKKSYYDVIIITNIINHYRNLINPKITNLNFLTLIGLSISMFTPLIGNDFSFELVVTYSSYYISLFIVIGMLWICYKQFKLGIKIFKKELGMYERLECIFSDILCDVIKENESVKKENILTKIINKFFNF